MPAVNEKITVGVDFGSAQSGLATVGYEIRNGDNTVYQARTTANVTEAQSGTGIYGVELADSVFTAAFDGYLLWDTGTGTPKYAREDLAVTDRVDVAISTRLAAADYTAPDNDDIAAVKAVTDTLPTALSAIDADVLTRATQASVDALGSPLQTDDARLDDLDATISSRASQASIDALGTPEQADDPRLDNLDAAVSSRSTYDGSDTPGMTTLLGRLTDSRAAALDYLDATISGIADTVWAFATRTLTSDPAPTAAEIAGQVWDEPSADHLTAGTTGKKLDDAAASASSPEEIAEAIVPLLGSIKVTVETPVAQNGDIQVIQGDSYQQADNRQIEFTITDGPDLTTADDDSVVLNLKDNLSATATVVAANICYIEFDHDDTVGFDQPAYEYALTAAFTGRPVTLQRGTVIVQPEIQAA